jgi:hypothetical protein
MTRDKMDGHKISPGDWIGIGHAVRKNIIAVRKNIIPKIKKKTKIRRSLFMLGPD